MFAAGESADLCLPLIDELAARGCASLLNCAVEADETVRTSNGPLLDQAVLNEISAAIRVAGSRTRRSAQLGSYQLVPTIVAVKLTGMVRDAGALVRASTAILSSSEHHRGERIVGATLFPLSPELSPRDLEALDTLYGSLREICGEARRLGVRIDIDAEQSDYQPAIDHLWWRLASEYNLGQPAIVFNTIQCYRTDAMERLQSDMAFARRQGFSYGVKLVRGAYVDFENERAKQHKVVSPIWPTKAATDSCYDAAAALVTDTIADEIKSGRQDTYVLYASHNADSARRVLERFRELGLMRNRGDGLAIDERLRGRIAFGQLLGMADALTGALLAIFSPHSDDELDLAPCVLKYVPFGAVDAVLPYLVRRAQDNKAVLHGRGGAKTERLLVGKELRRRLGF